MYIVYVCMYACMHVRIRQVEADIQHIQEMVSAFHSAYAQVTLDLEAAAAAHRDVLLRQHTTHDTDTANTLTVAPLQTFQPVYLQKKDSEEPMLKTTADIRRAQQDKVNRKCDQLLAASLQSSKHVLASLAQTDRKATPTM